MSDRRAESLDVLAERVRGLERTFADHLARIVAVAGERDDRYMAQFGASEKAVANALVAAKELTAQAFASSEKAIAESKVAQADVNAKSNEFRGQLKDQNETMIPRPEAAALFRAVDEKVEELRKAVAVIREQATAYPTRNEVGTLIAGLGKDVTELRESRSASQGRGVGVSATTGMITFVIATLIGLMVIGTFVFITSRQMGDRGVVYQPAQPGTLLPSTPGVSPTGR